MMTVPLDRERRARQVASRMVTATVLCLSIFLGGYLYYSQQQFDAQRARADLFGAIFETTEVPFLVVTDRGLITEWNPAAEQVIGWKREEVIGSDLIFLMADAALRYKHAELWRQPERFDTGLLPGRSLRVKCWINRKNDEPFEAYLEINEVSLANKTHLYTAEIKEVNSLVDLGGTSALPGNVRSKPVQREGFNEQRQIRDMLQRAKK